VLSVSLCWRLGTGVKYDDVLYPGEVREVGDKEVKVSAMIKLEKYDK